MIEDTACKNCPFKAKGEECPNYIETLWHEEGCPQPRIVKDCSPKRMLLMLQELYNRTFSLQKQISQQEAEILQSKGSVNNLINAIQYIQEHKKTEIEMKKRYLEHLSSMPGKEL